MLHMKSARSGSKTLLINSARCRVHTGINFWGANINHKIESRKFSVFRAHCNSHKIKFSKYQVSFSMLDLVVLSQILHSKQNMLRLLVRSEKMERQAFTLQGVLMTRGQAFKASSLNSITKYQAWSIRCSRFITSHMRSSYQSFKLSFEIQRYQEVQILHLILMT